MQSWENKKLKDRLEVSEYNGDDGLLGYDLKFEGLFNKDEIEKIKNILGVNEDEINIVEIVRNMKTAINSFETANYQKLGIDLHELLSQYFLKNDGGSQ